MRSPGIAAQPTARNVRSALERVRQISFEAGILPGTPLIANELEQ